MSVAWLNAAALAGLAVVTLPIVIHLLVRQQTRTMPFPSLRFLAETSLSAFRRRTLRDLLLLLCRVAIVGLAALAFAGPVLETPARTAAHGQRSVRAVVVVDPEGADVADRMLSDAYRAARFERTALGDAIADARRWLDQQPAAAREMVLVGRLPRGAVTGEDLSSIPDGIGIRFVEGEHATGPTLLEQLTLTLRGNAMVYVERAVQLKPDVTEVTDGRSAPAPADVVRVVAAAPQQALADAALIAALGAGVPWRARDQRVVLVWEGADDAAVARVAAGAEVVRMSMPEPAAAASAVTGALTRWANLETREPFVVPTEQLHAWTREPGPPSPDAPLSDEGDRRWVWALVLTLLALEHWLRRRGARLSASIEREARVA